MLGQPDLELFKGSDYNLAFTIYEDVEETIVRNISGYGTPFLRVGTVDFATSYVSINGTLQDPVNGLIYIPISDTALDTVPTGPNTFQLYVVDSSSNIQVARSGFLRLHAALPVPA